MHEESQVTMTLAIANRPSDLLVIGVTGRDRLNAPFCFDIDLVTPDPALDLASLRSCDAGLHIGTGAVHVHGVHGQIHDARQLHRGKDLSLYRLRLMPALQRLCGAPRRQAFNGLSVPQILMRLLHDNGVGDDEFRFDRLVGVYPRRAQCLQYDESDLHFLHRLCEEEGIAFRHEHHVQRHTLVFSDDPMGFPEWPTAAFVDHLAEQLSARTSYSSQAGERYTPQHFAPARRPTDADNQPLCMGPNDQRASGQRQQLSARLLERLRCERRDILGRSRLPWLRAGLVMRVEEQPEPWLNDQWLLTDVRHSAWQLAPLKGCASLDVIHMLQAMASADTPDREIGRWLRLSPGADRPALAGYENSFRVLPWTLPFRPPIEHPKPIITSTDLATWVDEPADKAGRVRIRYQWQGSGPESGSLDSWARVAGSLDERQAGSTLHIRFFEGDPDQPLVCGVVGEHVEPPARADEAGPRSAGSPSAADRKPEPLHIDSPQPLTLRGAGATLHISEQGVRYTPRMSTDDPA